MLTARDTRTLIVTGATAMTVSVLGLQVRGAVTVQRIDEQNRIGLANGRAAIVFRRDDGKLVELCNTASGDNYLKRVDGVGNVFRVFVGQDAVDPCATPARRPAMCAPSFPT